MIIYHETYIIFVTPIYIICIYLFRQHVYILKVSYPNVRTRKLVFPMRQSPKRQILSATKSEKESLPPRSSSRRQSGTSARPVPGGGSSGEAVAEGGKCRQYLTGDLHIQQATNCFHIERRQPRRIEIRQRSFLFTLK